MKRQSFTLLLMSIALALVACRGSKSRDTSPLESEYGYSR